MKRYRLKPWVKYSLAIIGLVIVILGLITILNNNMEKHIEKVSMQCAEKGYGIKAYHTKDGDKFYTCNVGDENE